ncbi:MAG: rod shape-determining protein RodA [Flavobacteriales bacterium AspAUS03]
MSKRNKTLLGNIDWWIVLIYLAMVCFGWMNIYSVTFEKADKQLIWIALSFVLILAIFLLSPTDYKYFSFTFYLMTLFLLIGVLIFGKTINGAKAWYTFGPISFQPAELAKIATALVIARVMSQPNVSIKNSKTLLTLGVLLGSPIALILLQPDPGSVLVFSSFMLVFYREGLSMQLILIGLFLVGLFLLSLNLSPWLIMGSMGMIFLLYMFFFPQKKSKNWILPVFIFVGLSVFVFDAPIMFEKLLKQHHKDRITILFKDEFDKKYRDNIGYNLFSSKAAIASGEFSGKGFQKGTVTKGKFVPEQYTDYIFCTVGEEWGFRGSALLIIIYLLFIGRIYFLAEKQKDSFARVFGYSAGSILLLHLVINLGMVMGLLPTVGIPLPFFSYGGSSLWSFTVLVFIFIRLNASDRNSLI